MGSVTGYTKEHIDELVDDTLASAAIVGKDLVTTTKGGAETNLGPIVENPGTKESEILILGKTDKFHDTTGLPKSSSGDRIQTIGMNEFDFEPGMGPFFSQVLPDGTIAMPQIQLTVNQFFSTGKTMSMGFWSQADSEFYTVVVPTTEGITETLAVNLITGVEDTAGGADFSDCVVVEIDGQSVLFALSCLPYRGWHVATYGEYPVLAAFVKSDTTGRWEYSETLSIFPVDLQTSDLTHGEDAWPNQDNYFGETVVVTKGPAEIALFPQSNHIVMSIYGPRAGHNSGAVVVIDPEAKTQAAYYEFDDFTSISGATFRAFPRDINTDPTSDVNDERFLLNFDTFTQPNEKFNVVVNATTGTFRVSWNGNFTSNLAVGISRKDFQTALEGLTGLGVGKVKVSLFRPFLVNTYSVYEVELIGALKATDFSATAVTIDVSLLGGNISSAINRWQHGGAGYTASTAFPMIEMSYNVGAATILPTSALLFPQEVSDDLLVPESLDGKFAQGWYDSEGTAWMTVHGARGNPQASTIFGFKGLHAWRKIAGERRYTTDFPPVTGWEDHFGEYRPYPDLMTSGQHKDNNAFILSLSEDAASGGIVAGASNGKLKLVEPTSLLANRSDKLEASALPSNWVIVAGGSHAGVWDAGNSRFALTAGSTADMEANSPTGLAGIAIPEDYVGQLLQVEIDVKAAATRRLNTPIIRFYDSGGTIIDALSGYGTASVYSKTTGYTRIVGSAIVPEGTAFISVGVAIKEPLVAEVHYVNRAVVYVAPCFPIDDINLGISGVFVGETGSAWLAKGFVDINTRRLWLPYLQQMSSATAKNTRFPAWLVGVDLSMKFRDRRQTAARIPLSHASSHSSGSEDAIDPLDIGAPNAANPVLTGTITFNGITIITGTGSPNGVLAAPVSSLYLDTNSGWLWRKASGISTSGWLAIGKANFNNRQTANYVLGLSDDGKVVEMNVAGANTWTVPANATVAFPNGAVIEGAQYGAGTTTIVPAVGVTIRSRGGRVISAGQYARWKVEKLGTNEWYLSGDLV